MRRVIADTERVGEFVMSRMPFPLSWTNYKAIGVELDGDVKAGVVYEGFTRFDVNMHVAIDDPRALNYLFLFAVFDYPFNTCGLRRVTGLVPSSNTKALEFDINKVGFKVEGLVRKALANDEDLWVLGMLKEECKWIRGRKQAQK